ncbi:hypothetical protein EJ02DRAFT_511711 [Clathrospora elynae]|uniref:RapZ C-terminal domain-containing protein n=1 Tax=Clathrospora elynae TaxID=706981 RepID=A0A6A5SP81_9PLEO|nr:hypothetical protein EJ02DRAFT_511711 [Clathrospora elynae]
MHRNPKPHPQLFQRPFDFDFDFDSGFRYPLHPLRAYTESLFASPPQPRVSEERARNNFSSSYSHGRQPIQTEISAHPISSSSSSYHRLRRKASRHVHFDLPLRGGGGAKMQAQKVRDPHDDDDDDDHHNHHRPHFRHHSHKTQHQSYPPHALPQPPRPILRTRTPPLAYKLPQPTIYIITFAASLTYDNEAATNALLSSQVPLRTPPIQHLYTIDARSMQPPSATLCAQYSGISPLIQDVVMQDKGAKRAVERAVWELLRFGQEQGFKERGMRRRGVRREVSMSVCCHAGTHRSVAIAERIAQCVKLEVGRLGKEGVGGVDEGVRVVCRHVHRVKGRGDPF